MTSEKPQGRDCSVRVYSGHRSDWSGHMCSKQATVRRDGKDYCGVHDPEKVSKRKAIQDARYKAQEARTSAGWAVRSAERTLMEATEAVGPNALREYPTIFKALLALAEARKKLRELPL